MFSLEHKSNKHDWKMNCGFVRSEVIHKRAMWFDNEEDVNPIAFQSLWPFWTLVAFPEAPVAAMEHTTGYSCLPAVAPQHI